MPKIRQYIITQTRQVIVNANDSLEAHKFGKQLLDGEKINEDSVDARINSHSEINELSFNVEEIR